MGYHVIACHYDVNGKMIGFRTIEETSNKINDMSIKGLTDFLANGGKVSNCILDSNGEVKGSNGTLNRYAKIIGMSLRSKAPAVVICKYGDDFIIADWKGKLAKATQTELLNYCKSNGIANGKIVNKNGTEFVSAINGEYDYVEPKGNKKAEIKKVESEEEKKSKSLKAKKSIIKLGVSADKKIVNLEIRPKISAKDMDCEDFDGTVYMKFMYALQALKYACPFMYCTISGMRIIDTPVVDTMAVTLKELLYNPEFVRDMKLQHIVFALIHEACHVAMMHNARAGDRIHNVWNMATDLYINSVIVNDFGLSPKGGIKALPNDIKNVGIEAHVDEKGKFIGLYSEKVDIVLDTPEEIYKELMESLNNQKESDDKSNGNSNSSNASGNESGGNGEGDPSEGDAGNDSTGDGDTGDKDNSEENGGSESEQEGQGSEPDSDDGEQGNTSSRKSGNAGKILKLRGEDIARMGDESQVDLVMTAEEADLSNDAKKIMARQHVDRAEVMAKQIGENASNLETRIKELNAPKVDWRRELRHLVTKAGEKINTYSAPDRRFISRGMIMPGPKALDSDNIEGVKVCLDTSGSMGTKELGEAMGHVKALLKKYKTNGELIHWDAEIEFIENFKDYDEIKKRNAIGGGRTSPACLFEYFNSKKCKEKPNVILIFTDGLFNTGNLAKYKQKYGRNTVWVITKDCYSSFNEPFGKKALIKIEE